MNSEQPTPSAQSGTSNKKPYQTPAITQVVLMTEEAVLAPNAPCRTPSGISPQVLGPCGGGACVD